MHSNKCNLCLFSKIDELLKLFNDTYIEDPLRFYRHFSLVICSIKNYKDNNNNDLRINDLRINDINCDECINENFKVFVNRLEIFNYISMFKIIIKTNISIDKKELINIFDYIKTIYNDIINWSDIDYFYIKIFGYPYILKDITIDKETYKKKELLNLQFKHNVYFDNIIF
jgi:hypothetical protein